MQISFCGGAGEVGASCILLKIDEKNILLDCGIRMSSNKDTLPDLRKIQDNGGIDAIVISHGHMDHIGALPIISKEYPNARIYMTHGTKGLTRVLLYDSIKIMNKREAEIPLYSENHVQEMLDRILCFSPEYKIKLFNDRVLELSFYNAGHIIGAACVYLSGSEGSFFYSGDISIGKQHTVEGASIPRLRPDAAIVEATYGDKLHSNRQAEEERLIEIAKTVSQRGGKLIIPAFAVGRAQEVILILKKAMNKKQMPEMDVYVDGMVKDVCRIYKNNPNYLRNDLKKKLLRAEKDIFFNESIKPVDNREMRKEVIESSKPCCIISSSGMISGGPVQEYIKKLAGDERNYIALTGYQDEEAPGRRILELMDEEPDKRQLTMDEITLPVKCGIGRYGLSAHADKSEIIGLLKKLEPRKTYLVHGEKSILSQFSREVYSELRGRVYTPRNDDQYEISFDNPRKQLNNKLPEPLGISENMDNYNIEKLWKYLWESGGCEKAYTVEDLCYLWRGYIDEEEKNWLYDNINSIGFFEGDERRAFLFRAKKPEDIKAESIGIMEVNDMLKTVDAYFTREMGLYKKGARQEAGVAILSFVFPGKVSEKHSEEIERFEKDTGWKIELNENCNQMLAEQYIAQFLEQNSVSYVKLVHQPNINTFVVKTSEEVQDKELIQQRFYDDTGVNLKIEWEGTKSTPGIDGINKTEDKMEINQAFSYIDRVFEGFDHQPQRKSKKTDNMGEYIELAFVTPIIGEKYIDIIKDLQKDIKWRVLVADKVNQNDIILFVNRKAQELDIKMKKNPGIHVSKSAVQIYPVEDVSRELIEKLGQSLIEYCGYSILL